MRKETRNIAKAFLNHEKATAARTMTDGESVFLHGNEIAFWNYGDVKPALCFTLAGWPSVTTRERINGILELSGSNWRVKQHKGDQFLINTVIGYIVPILDNEKYYAPQNDDDMPEAMRDINASARFAAQ